MPRIATRCPTCAHSLKRGHLWLSGSDYLVCPDCGGTTQFVVYEHHVTPGRIIAVPGLRPPARAPGGVLTPSLKAL